MNLIPLFVYTPAAAAFPANFIFALSFSNASEPPPVRHASRATLIKYNDTNKLIVYTAPSTNANVPDTGYDFAYSLIITINPPAPIDGAPIPIIKQNAICKKKPTKNIKYFLLALPFAPSNTGRYHI